VIRIEVDPCRADAADQDHADTRVPRLVGGGEGGGEGLRDLRGNRLVHPAVELVDRIREKIVGVEAPTLIARAIAERLTAHAR
jgi:hypothetical protein